PGGMAGHMPSLEDMKKMADTKAAPLIDKLKSDPNNVDLLTQVGNIYKATHQFKDAATYYDKIVQVDPKNVAMRTELASCLYYNGDVDGALGQLQQSLHYDPRDANSLFNLGVIKWQGKQDAKGALTAWQELLKTNPQLSADKIEGAWRNDGQESNSFHRTMDQRAGLHLGSDLSAGRNRGGMVHTRIAESSGSGNPSRHGIRPVRNAGW